MKTTVFKIAMLVVLAFSISFSSFAGSEKISPPDGVEVTMDQVDQSASVELTLGEGVVLIVDDMVSEKVSIVDTDIGAAQESFTGKLSMTYSSLEELEESRCYSYNKSNCFPAYNRHLVDSKKSLAAIPQLHVDPG